MNPFIILQIALKGMEITQKILAGKSKQEKIDNAINEATEILQITELVANKDILKDERLQPFVEKYYTAAKDLYNKIQEVQKDVKDLKAQ